MAKLLFVEDDEELSKKLLQWLTHEQHLVEHAQTGSDALEKLEHFQYDVVILDIGLPDMTGIDILRRFRNAGGTTPVIFLTGKNEIEDKIAGLDAGADDYLPKPFDARELSARIRSLVRRPSEFSGSVLTIGKLTLNPASHQVIVDGKEVKLKPRELSLLEYLIRNSDKVVSPDELVNRVWHSDSDATSETIYTHIKNIRKKLADAGVTVIETVHGSGYIVRKNG